MARVKPDQPLVPSVLDRLLDDDPDVTTEPPRTRPGVARTETGGAAQSEKPPQYAHVVPALAAELKELEKSLVTYGIPDFTGNNLASTEKRQALCRILETVIRPFQPAFLAVTVRVRDDDDPLDGTLHFRIDALLRAQPAPEPMAFDPNLDLDTGNFKFEESSP